jgi:hypothetical protein
MPFRPEKAQALGIDVEQVGRSWAHHLSEARQKARENPQTLHAPEADTIAVIQKSGPTALRWETLSPLPHGIPEITVHASSREASKNRVSVTQLLERRYKRELGLALIRAGEFPDTVEGMRGAMGRAMRASVFVAEVG